MCVFQLGFWRRQATGDQFTNVSHPKLSRPEQNDLGAPAQVVGATARRLDGDTRLVRSQETNLGDILADAMVASIARTMFSQVRTW